MLAQPLAPYDYMYMAIDLLPVVGFVLVFLAFLILRRYRKSSPSKTVEFFYLLSKIVLILVVAIVGAAVLLWLFAAFLLVKAYGG
jgi:uncharacterized membrane protein